MSKWSVSFDRRAVRELSRLDKPVQRELVAYLEDRVLSAEDPRQLGHALKHDSAGSPRYRVRDFCQIRAEELIILKVSVGHRSSVYR